MKILYAASEAAPFAKSGGLADVAGALPKALVRDGIDARVDQAAGLPFGGLQFVVPHERVERGMDPHSEAVGILHDPGDLLRGVPRGLPRAEPRAADIDRIGAVVYGGRGRSVIFGRS